MVIVPLITMNHLYKKNILKTMPSPSRYNMTLAACLFRWRLEAVIEAEFEIIELCEHLYHKEESVQIRENYIQKWLCYSC
jgi:hypothetical protein